MGYSNTNISALVITSLAWKLGILEYIRYTGGCRALYRVLFWKASSVVPFFHQSFSFSFTYSYHSTFCNSLLPLVPLFPCDAPHRQCTFVLLSGYNIIMDTATLKQNKISLCVARHNGTKAHATREQPMDTGPKVVETYDL